MNWSDIFLFCFVAGTLWAFAAVLLGGFRIAHFGHAHVQVGHMQHHAPAKLHSGSHGHLWGHLVNPSCIAIFLAWFGGVGYMLLRHSHMQLSLDLCVAAAAGLVGAIILARFLALLQDKERVMNPVDYEMVGTLGQVAAAIRPAGVGEVLYVRDGARRAIPARSEDGVIIPLGTEVIVLRYEKGVAYVRTWDAMTQ